MANFHVLSGAAELQEHTRVRKIEVSDLFDALRRGLDDFMMKPSHLIFLFMIYPIMGVILAAWTTSVADALPLLFPLVSGFALIGPVTAIGLYEISRRREAGLDTSWSHAIALRHSPALPSIAAVALVLFALFIVWLLTAKLLYQDLFGPEPPASLWAFFSETVTTRRGWTLIALGHAIGLVFAAIVLCTTIVAFPLLLDRDVGAYEAVHTSVRVAMANPVPTLVWGMMIAALLIIGSLPLLVGLAIVLPVLGHATWHLYRKVIEPLPASSNRIERSGGGTADP